MSPKRKSKQFHMAMRTGERTNHGNCTYNNRYKDAIARKSAHSYSNGNWNRLSKNRSNRWRCGSRGSRLWTAIKSAVVFPASSLTCDIHWVGCRLRDARVWNSKSILQDAVCRSPPVESRCRGILKLIVTDLQSGSVNEVTSPWRSPEREDSVPENPTLSFPWARTLR
jgi:hypothetical protein